MGATKDCMLEEQEKYVCPECGEPKPEFFEMCSSCRYKENNK
jgi:NMD protein affecting ribosome stability and mRNA decay